MKVFRLITPIVISVIFVYLEASSAQCAESDSSSQNPTSPLEQSLTPEALEQSLLFDRNGDGQLSIIAFGDSMTRGTGDFTASGEEVFSASKPEGEAGYPLRIEMLLNISVLNRGVPGERLTNTGVARFVDLVTTYRPDIVIILEGANDAFINVNEREVLRHFQTLINISRALGVEPVISTIPTPCVNHIKLHDNIIGYNDAIRNIVQNNDINLADVDTAYRNTCDVYSCWLLNLPEGLHPNIDGYDVIGEMVVAALLNIDLLAPDGSANYEAALNLSPGAVTTIPNTTPSSELSN